MQDRQNARLMNVDPTENEEDNHMLINQAKNDNTLMAAGNQLWKF